MSDPHRHRDDVHYRLYLPRDGAPTVICVQWFDYFDYDEAGFLSPEAWDDETDAEQALNELVDALNAGSFAGTWECLAAGSGWVLTQREA